MATITIETVSYDDATIGRLWCGSFRCFTLELPWLDNKQNISCIPAGIYEYNKRFSPNKQAYVLELKDVPDRTYIQIHAGNYTRQIEGCCLVGLGIKYLDGDDIPDVTNSGDTLDELLEHAPNTGTIEVIRHG